MSRFFRAIRAAALVEYGIILAMISVVAITAIATNGQRIRDIFQGASDKVDFAMQIATAERVIDLLNGEKFPAQKCKVGTSGADVINGGTKDGDTPDCYDLKGGGDTLDIAVSPARNVLYYVASGSNTIALPDGNHLIEFAQAAASGTDRISFGSGQSAVNFPGMASTDVSLEVEGDKLKINHNGKILTILGQYASTTPVVSGFYFTDGSSDAVSMAAAALADQSTPGNDTITGTSLDDVISPLTGTDTIVPYGGDDTIIYSGGSKILVGGSPFADGIDTLDMSSMNRADVSFSRSFGMLTITVASTFDQIQIFNEYSTPMNIDRIVFADQTMDASALNAIP